MQTFLDTIVGRWAGTMRTYFEPGVLADESPVTGAIRPVLGGAFWEHTYSGGINGTSAEGRAIYAFNAQLRRFEAAWIDTFHTASAILYSVGEPDAGGFAVLTHYGDPAQGPLWGWRTELALDDEGEELQVRMYNITPDGEEAVAVEMICRRVDSTGDG